MSAELRVGDKDYKGRTLDSIVRREFGQKAFIKPWADPNQPGVGQIVVPAPYGGFIVKGTVSYAYEYKRPPKPPSSEGTD